RTLSLARQVGAPDKRLQSPAFTEKLMRITLLLSLGAAILVAACADDHPTAPTGSRNASGSLAAGAASLSSGPSGQGKTTGPVGFTKITLVIGDQSSFNPAAKPCRRPRARRAPRLSAGPFHSRGTTLPLHRHGSFKRWTSL